MDRKYYNFIDALDDEIRAVKNTTNKGINLRDGNLCYEDLYGGYYVFEVPSVHNIPHVSARIDIKDKEYISKVTFCSAGIVELFIESFHEKTVNYAKLYVNSWQLIEKLKTFFTQIESNKKNYKLFSLLQDLHFNPLPPNKQILLGPQNAIAKAYSDPITLIWGPPGTGKTHTLANIAVNAMKDDKHVLIVSQSNVAVDGAIKKIVSFLKNDNEILDWDGKCFRLGFVSDYELEKSPVNSFWYSLKKNQVDLINYEECSRQMRNKGISHSKYKQLRNLRSDIIKRTTDVETNILNSDSTRVIATTITKALMTPCVLDRKWDLVIIDEVSMANVPQVLSIASLSSSQIVLVGDFRQLKPISVSNRKELSFDIFSYLNVLDENSNVINMPYLVMLNEQRRMHSKLIEFINENLYLNKMVVVPEIQKNREKNITIKQPFTGDPITIIDYSEYKNYCDATKTGSRFNPVSAYLAVSVARNVIKEEVCVDIITPYVAQADLINLIVQEENLSNKIKASTVHQFQGSENDVIIFDLVESYPKRKIGKLLDNEDDDDMDAVRLLNVASTRARGKLIILANLTFLKDCNNSSVLDFINYWDKQKKLCYTEIASFIKKLNINSKTYGFFTNITQAEKEFTKDFNAMKSGFIYFHSLHSESGKNIDKIFTLAEKRQKISLVVCSKNASINLPKKLYINRLKTSDPIANYNPKDEFFIIDNHIFWYGVPVALMKKGIIPTSRLCYTILRIKSIVVIELLMKYMDFKIPSEYRIYKSEIKNTSSNEKEQKDKSPVVYQGKPRIDYFVDGALVYNEKNGFGTILEVKKTNHIIVVSFDIEGIKKYKYPEIVLNKGIQEVL